MSVMGPVCGKCVDLRQPGKRLNVVPAGRTITHSGTSHQLKMCWFGVKCKYPYCPYWHKIATRGIHSRGFNRNSNNLNAAEDSRQPYANYFWPLAEASDAIVGGGPQRAVRRSGQRRTPHRPIHTYPPGANSCNPVLHSERTHTSGAPQTLSERSTLNRTAVAYTRPDAHDCEDLRHLEVPIPRSKQMLRRRAGSQWTWKGWKAWQQQQMLKGWRKKEVQRAIFLRDSDPANQGIDFTRVEELWDRCGVIYGLYHFTSGRWYVGQTKKRD